jgi:hypothetical protein
MRENKEKKRSRLLAKASQVTEEYLSWEDPYQYPHDIDLTNNNLLGLIK